MPRKKKEEPEIYRAPFGSTTIPSYPEIDLSPYTIETTALGDSQRRFVTTTYPGTSITTYTGSYGDSRTIYYPSVSHPSVSYPSIASFGETSMSGPISYEDLMRKMGGEEETKVELSAEDFKNEYVVCCRNTPDLLSEHILTTLSAAKGKLMFEVAPIHIKEITCKMTPEVKKNIINASKRLKMYGKKSPIIPSFDEYGNRLPDQIEIGDNRGIIVQIVNPEEYGMLYFELTAIKIPDMYYNPTWSGVDWAPDAGIF